MPEKWQIRPAVAADIRSMVGLLAGLFAIESDFHFDAVLQEQGLRQLLGDKQATLLVAEYEGTVVGMCTMQRLISTAEGGPVGLVEDLVVDDAYRGQGIGTALLASIEAEGVRRGFTRLQLLADLDNAPALQFYAATGWHTTSLVALRRPVKR